MIELIFVIVILGILAAVAIPKLAATRTDAGVSKIASNVATLVSDLGAYYTSKGTFAGANWDQMTNVHTETTAAGGTTTAGVAWVSGTVVYLNNGTTAAKSCFSIGATTDGNVSIIGLAGGTDAVCVGAKAASAKNGMSDPTDGTARIHEFGGTGVSY